MREIEIDYRSGLATNTEQALLLSRMAPTAHRVGQDVLVAAKRVLRKQGLFSTERSRLENLVKTLVNLNTALERDSYSDVLLDLTSGTDRDRIFVFFNRFARAYPNWQPEYELLNEVIPKIFPSPAGHNEVPPPRPTAPGRTDVHADTDKTERAKAIISCPQCFSRMRVPVGIRIAVTCKQCQHRFIEKVENI